MFCVGPAQEMASAGSQFTAQKYVKIGLGFKNEITL